MEQNIDNKIELKDRLIPFYNNNKFKIYIFTGILLAITIFTILLKINQEKKNSLISEKYIEAGLLLNSGKKEKSKKIYEEIILSKNKFYSTLALNNILEKELISDKDLILEYFQIIEDNNMTKEQIDLIVFKKALYFLKSGNNVEGNSLLKKLINENSKLKFLAEEALVK